MVSIILIILGAYLIAHVLYGYTKGRRLETEAGKIFYIGIGKRPLWSVKIKENKGKKKLPWWLSVIPLPWPLIHVWVMLEWWEYVEDMSKINDTITVLDTDTPKKKTGPVFLRFKTEPKYKQTKKFKDDQGFMGLRKELVPCLRVYEHVHYDIEVVTADKYIATFILSFTFEIFRAMKVIDLPSFKMIGLDQTSSQLKPLINEKGVDDIYTINMDTMEQLTVKGERLDHYLDRVHFRPNGFRLFKKGLDIIESEKMLNYFKLKNQLKETKQRGENAKEEANTREIQRGVELADATQEIKIMKSTITEAQKALAPLIRNIYKGKAQEKAARKYVLFEQNNTPDDTGKEIIQMFKDKIPDIKNTTSSKKFEREEEVADAK